nr:DUF3265 domain-containing protein [Vibrio crassostreae]
MTNCLRVIRNAWHFYCALVYVFGVMRWLRMALLTR